jgi:hypothetical protein
MDPTPAAAPPVDGMIPVLNPAGELVRIPQADLQRAFAQGFQPPTPEQIASIAQRERLGSPGQAAVTALEHAGSALTMGLSTGLEVGLGVPAEDIRGRSEANPVAGGVGTVAGVALPLLATAGAAGPLEAGAAGAGVAADVAAGAGLGG